MRKQIALFCIFIGLFLPILSGCLDVDIPEDILQFSITNFEVDPSIIVEGETANLSWIVLSGKSASIDNKIGNVSLMGSRIIMPTTTTNYTLTALNATTTLSATTQIIVIPAEDPWPDETTSISLDIYSKNSAIQEIIWEVNEVEGDLIDGESLTLELLKENLTIDLYASISYSDIDLDGYVSTSDIFTVVASQEDYYFFRIRGLTTGEILFKSPLVEY